MENENTTPIKNTNFYFLLGVLIVLLLAAAAYVGGRLLREGKAVSKKEESIEILAAQGLPEIPFELVGDVSSQDGNSLFVQTKQLNKTLGIIAEKGVDGDSSIGYTSPPTEVVITHETELFRDATWDPFFSGEANKEEFLGGQIQQEILPGSPDELGSGSSITVWGERNGDRVVAEYILYSLPFPDEKIIK